MFLPRLPRLVTMSLALTVGVPPCLLPHGGSLVTAEEKEARLQRWGRGWVGPADRSEALQLEWPTEGERP